MKVLFLGTPGIQRRHALRSVLDSARRLFPTETIFTVEQSRDRVVPVGADDNSSIPVLEDHLYSDTPSTLLEKPAFLQRQNWRAAFRKLCTQYEKSRERHFFLSAHLLYRYTHVSSIAADVTDLAKWKPDCIVTFIDDVYCVRERIQKRGFKAFSLRDLLLWRAEELLLGDLLARIANRKSPPPNYLVSVRHPVDKLMRLLMSHNPAGRPKDKEHGRIYLSYNISDTRQTAEGREEIDNFRRRFYEQQHFFVFDPLTIDELPPVYHCRQLRQATIQKEFIDYDPREPTWRWPWLAHSGELKPITDDSDLIDSYPLRIPCAEIEDADSTIDAQVRNRDFRLEDQAHCLGLWRPTMTRESSVSAGVRGEMEFARDRGIRLLAYLKASEDKLPTSAFLNYLNPNQNPDIILADGDTKFWQLISEIQPKKLDSSRNHFLL